MATAIRVDDARRSPTTAEELLLMPEGTHGEIVEGVYVPMTGGAGPHGSVTARVTFALTSYAYAQAAGEVFGSETTFRLARGPDTARCPDVTFVTAERLPLGVQPGVFEGAPDLAVEVLSPSNTVAEMERKRAEYVRYGARQVWIVDPETRTVAVHVAGGLPRFLAGDDALEGGDLLPGFSTSIAAFFLGLPAVGSPPRA